MEKQADIIIVGLGNPILRDDSVGLKIARELSRHIPPETALIAELAIGGWELLEAITGYKKAVIIDSIKTRGGNPGEYYRITMEDFRDTYHITNPHNLNFATAIELGRNQGYPIPEIIIYAVEVEDNSNFGEDCTEAVKRVIPEMVDLILTENFNLSL
ncbi:hydrogenase maturation protease [bacterium]|nr:hydrogenase maturation protease [bacterium]